MHPPFSRLAAALIAFAAVVAIGPGGPGKGLGGRGAFARGPEKDAASRDLERARVLDQQGVRAYKEERYNDAIRYFVEARKLGGPSSELWNIAKCHVHLDQPEEA